MRAHLLVSLLQNNLRHMLGLVLSLRDRVFMRLKKLNIAINNWSARLKKYLVFYICFYRLKVKNFFRFLFLKIEMRLFFMLSLIYFLGIFIVATKMTGILSGSFLFNEGVTFFTATGAMLGGVLAIVFSLSTFLMQNAAQHSSAGFYDVLEKDR